MKQFIKVLVIVFALPALAAPAGGKGQGAIVLRDGAPVYKKSGGEEVTLSLKRGDSVAGWKEFMGAPGGILWQFGEKDGRIGVAYHPPDAKGHRLAWMDPKDVARFTYDGSCEKNAAPETGRDWNACFQEARDAKLEELKAKWAAEDATKKDPPPAEPKP